MISVVKRAITFALTRKNSELGSLFLFVCFGCLLLACSPASRQIEHLFSGQIMGTYFRITMIGENEEDLIRHESALQDTMESVNQSMSNYIDDSQVSRFNRMPAQQSMQVSIAFADVIRESLIISELSAGAFDITVSPLINAWGFGEDGAVERQPGQAELDRLAKTIGYQRLKLKGQDLAKSVDGLEVNVSAIAKGYAVDQLSEYLLNAGVHNFLVDIGGEIRAAGSNLAGDSWRVAIENPTILGGVHKIIGLSDIAIATSGDYRNFLVIDGQQFSHTINPVTFKPSLHKLASVSVVSDKCSTADGLATALMVMGDERGFEFAKENKLAVYMLVRTAKPDEYTILMTEEFRRILQ